MENIEYRISNIESRIASRLPASRFLLLALFSLFMLFALSAFAQEPAYRHFPLIGSRNAIWIISQLHLMFAAFILGVPIFAVIVEYIGVRTKDPKFDRLAKEFTKLLLIAFSTTATFGAIMLFLLIGLYPNFFNYMSSIFFPTFVIYSLLFFGEGFSLYLYWYSWDKLMNKKWLHITFGIMLNVFGTLLMIIANTWVTFMMSPGGIDEQGALISLWGAINNFTWIPINIHRFIANICFGGFIVGAYAAYRFLSSKTDEERAHYDWMGYVGNFIGTAALIPLPFAGYWLGKEIYEYSEPLMIRMMGGELSWLFIIQAILIGVLFIGANYYLWIALSRIKGGERFRKYVKYMLFLLVICFAIWMTPHSLVASLEEARKIGATHHPLLGVFGVMSAKNTAVNLIILTTFFSFMLYQRANKIETVTWAKKGKIAQIIILGSAAGVVIFYGIYGYYVPAAVRIGFSVYQVSAVLAAMILVTILSSLILRGATSMGTIEWGKMPARSQYTLIVLALTIVTLMGLMGYIRSATRADWHVYRVLRDTSPEAFTPTIAYATQMISIITFIFFAFICFIFWLGHMGEKQ
ncbi:cytochrome ubiquinol oxidase subunit I [candidate division TA06 bacterium]|nr:cytochrome ubiquinol oxidase subunit I [candidate division TA06 bacterium]